MCNSFIPAPGGYSSGKAGMNNLPACPLIVNGGVQGRRLRVTNNFILPQVVVQERGKNCKVVDGRWLKCWCMLCLCDTHGGRDGLGTCVCPRGKLRWENCCGSRGAVAGRHAVICCAVPAPAARTVVVRGAASCPLLLMKLPSRKQRGGGGGRQHPPYTGHPPATWLFRACCRERTGQPLGRANLPAGARSHYGGSLLLLILCLTSRSKALGRTDGLCCVCAPGSAVGW